MSRIYLAFEKQNSKTPVKDYRGLKSGGGRKDNVIAKAITHINKFKRYQSHYRREQYEDQFFLEPGLTIKTMHDLYKECFSEDELSQALSYDRYRRVFHEHFNLKIKPLKTDTCATCDQFRHLEPEEQALRKEAHDIHWAKVERMKEQYNTDTDRAKCDPSFQVITFDMQKTHGLPDISTSENYYKRHLNVYIHGIHENASGRGKIVFNIFNIF